MGDLMPLLQDVDTLFVPTGRPQPDLIALQNAAWVAVPATTYQVTNRPQIRAPGRLEPVRRQVKVEITAQIASSGTNWMATMVESGTKPGSGSGLNSFPMSQRMAYCPPTSTMKPSVSARILVK